MKFFLIALMACFLTAVSNAELRTWTAVNGKQVKAEFVSSLRGNVKLRLESGKLYDIPRDKLSKQDHEFIAGLYKTEVIGSGIKAKPKSKIPVNLDQYRNAFADPSDRTDPYFTVTTWRYLTNKYKKTKNNYVHGLVEDVIFLFGQPDRKERKSERVRNLGAMAIAELAGNPRDISHTVDFVVYTYKNFWTDTAIDKKTDLKIYLNVNEPDEAARRLAKAYNDPSFLEPKVINGIKNTELYWDGNYTDHKGGLMHMHLRKDAESRIKELEKELPKKTLP